MIGTAYVKISPSLPVGLGHVFMLSNAKPASPRFVVSDETRSSVDPLVKDAFDSVQRAFGNLANDLAGLDALDHELRVFARRATELDPNDLSSVALGSFSALGLISTCGRKRDFDQFTLPELRRVPTAKCIHKTFKDTHDRILGGGE